MPESFVARDEIESRVTQALSRSRGAVLLGPRQAPLAEQVTAIPLSDIATATSLAGERRSL